MDLIRRPGIVAVALGAAFAVSAAPTSRADELRIDVGWDVGITAGLGSAWVLTELLKPWLAPASCRWCEPPAGDRAVRDALRWSDPQAAGALSYASAFALLPLLSFGLDAAEAYDRGSSGEAWEDVLLVAEAAAVAGALNQAVKLAAGRQRPFVWALDPADRGSTHSPDDNDLSFYSGHTTLAFALAVSSATVATLRDYDVAPWLWGAGLTLAAATGYLRIAADRHYLTDVLTGAAAGALIGWLVPYLHRDDDADAAEDEESALRSDFHGTILGIPL